jgi:DoxX-like family
MVTYALWIVQVLLALIFACAGAVKLVLPVDVLLEQSQVALPGVFIRFIGVVEVLGALGLILPGLLRIRPDLTPLAALGLVAVMLGAAMFTPPGSELAVVLMPIVLGLLAGFVAYGRARLAPHRGSARPSVLQSAG